MKSQKGFTLIELVIYMGLMAIVIGLFAGILVTIVRIQTQQTSSRQVASELNFVMNTITRDIRDGTTVEPHGNWIAIVTPSSSPDAMIIDISGGRVRKQENSSAPFSALTTDRVVADTLSFTELSSGGIKAVQVVLTLSFNTENPAQEYTQTLQTTAAPLKKAD